MRFYRTNGKLFSSYFGAIKLHVILHKKWLASQFLGHPLPDMSTVLSKRQQGSSEQTRAQRKKKPPCTCWGVALKATKDHRQRHCLGFIQYVFVSVSKKYKASQEALIPPWYDIMTDVRTSQVKSWSTLRLLLIWFILWHTLSSNHAYTLWCSFHDWNFFFAIEVAISLVSLLQLPIKPCFLSPFLF